MIKEGEWVLLWRNSRSNYLVKAGKNRFNTDCGYLDLEQLKGREFGREFFTHTKNKFYLLKPSLECVVMRGFKRRTQIIYPKDAAFIISKAGIFSGSRVLETGTGSGAMTAFLAAAVMPEGKVYSYERNPDFYANACNNLASAGLLDYVVIKNKEVKQGFDEEAVDFVMLDIPAPWELLGPVCRALKKGRKLASILPTVNQAERFVLDLEAKGFVNIEVFELWARRMLFRQGRSRPEQLMHSHTGYLIFAAKVFVS